MEFADDRGAVAGLFQGVGLLVIRTGQLCQL